MGGWHYIYLTRPGDTTQYCMWAHFRVSKDRSTGETQQMLQTGPRASMIETCKPIKRGGPSACARCRDDPSH